MKTLNLAAAALALTAAAGVQAQGFALEGAVIDSRTSQNLGVVSERGDINTLFRAQKAMTFGILRSAGISLEQLSPEVRARIERFQTTNLEAFRAFSQGLDLKDQGKFVEAKEFFRRAAELDPGFALAAEQQRAMPDANLGNSLQTRALIASTAGAAVDRGKAGISVDAARAVAAIAAGQSVVAVLAPANTEKAQTAGDPYTTIPPGSGVQFAPNLAAALTYVVATSSGLAFNLATSAEYTGAEYRSSGSALDSVGSLNRGFFAERLAANTAGAGSVALADGITTAYWGSWISAPGSSAEVSTRNGKVSAPQLGNVDYVFAEATRAMPTAGQGTYTPRGGSFVSPTGTVQVDFVRQTVTLQNLGFGLGGLTFTGLGGSTSYASNSGSGAFNGTYSSGTCTGCPALDLTQSKFGGNFVGRNADGMLFSTFLSIGNNILLPGVQVFTKP